MNVAVLVSSVSRNAGGVLDATRQLYQTLHSGGLGTIHVLSLKDQHTAADLPQWAPLQPRAFSVLGPASWGYAPQLSRALDACSSDLVHAHGLWMYPSVVSSKWQRRCGKPLLLTAHGMLEPWALRNSRWKKWVAGRLFENRHLHAAQCLHALNAAECASFRAYGLTQPICVIPNGINLPTENIATPRPPWENLIEKGQKVLLYLGRIHPKKNLPNLLRAWSDFQKAQPAKDWSLVIAGWSQGDEESKLKHLAEQSVPGGNVHFIGPQYGPAKEACYANATAFILPSLSEGLPMVVLEAWAYRLPVLMTRECNLPEGFAAQAALEITPEAASITQGLQDLAGLTETQRCAIGESGRNLVAQRFAWPVLASQMRLVYEWMAGSGSSPDCVQH